MGRMCRKHSRCVFRNSLKPEFRSQWLKKYCLDAQRETDCKAFQKSPGRSNVCKFSIEDERGDRDLKFF